MSSKKESKRDIWNWSSPADAAKDDSWNMMWRQFGIRLSDETKPIFHILEPMDPRNTPMPVPKKLAVPTNLALTSRANIEVFKMKREDINAARTRAIEHNKVVQSNYVRGLSILQSLFEGFSNVSLAITGVLVEGEAARLRFWKAVDQLRDLYRPSGIIDAMALKAELIAWSDSGRSHTDWEAGFQRVKAQMEALGEFPPLKEVDQIVINSLKNPHLRELKNKLLLDTTDDTATERTYTYVQLRKDAAKLARADKEVDLWGLSAGSKSERALFAGKQEGKPRTKTFTAGCWRCGGSHQKASCTSHTCSKCHRSIFENGTLQDHDTRYCGGGGQSGGAKKVFSKGGDDSGGKTDWKIAKPKIGAVNLPPAANFTNKQLKAFIAQANLVSESRKAASQPKKRKPESEWDPEEEA
jgi:hypothetical protein